MTDKPVIIAAAQICAKDEDIEHNLNAHNRLIHLAASNGVQLLVFPEMSITGYVREAAARLAFSRGDVRLNELRKLAAAYNMIIIAGAPVRLGSALHVGAFVMHPDQSVLLYTKQYLYKNEKDFYMPNCGNNPLITLENEKLSIAICFDMENTPHITKAADAGSSLYSASIFYSKSAIEDAHILLSNFAKTYSINVLMSNYSGYLYHTPAGGKSAFWSSTGERLASLEENETGLVIGIKNNGVWAGKSIVDDSGVYVHCPEYKHETLTLMQTSIEDAEELLKCYSDEKAVPLFNSDNCNGDDFHYTTLAQMKKIIDFWTYSYKTWQFVRWTIINNDSGAKIGTVEMFHSGTNASLGRYGILRIDLHSDYETRPVIADILNIADKHFYDAFDVDAILTKAIPAAAMRINTLLSSGYSALEGNLVKFSDYYVRKLTE